MKLIEQSEYHSFGFGGEMMGPRRILMMILRDSVTIEDSFDMKCTRYSTTGIHIVGLV